MMSFKKVIQIFQQFIPNLSDCQPANFLLELLIANGNYDKASMEVTWLVLLIHSLN